MNFKLFLSTLIWMKSYFLKKDKNIWVFGAVRGQKYMDNAKYLYEYVDKKTNITAIWLSKNNELVEHLKLQGFNAYHEQSKKGKFYAAKAKVAIVTHRSPYIENSDLPFFRFSKKTIIIQLWHGIPLKKIAYDDKVFSFKLNESDLLYKGKQYIKKYIFPYLEYVHNPTLIVALSNETKDIFSQAFRVSPSIVSVLGYPRNDILLQPTKQNKNNSKKQKKIIYMPTFRGEINSKFDIFLNYGFNVEEVDSFLDKNNMILDIKLHPFNQITDSLYRSLRASKNISFFNKEDIYDELIHYDILITDYSSIYFDYLLLERPIIFAPFDKKEYLQKDRDFYFEYESITPGPKATNWIEVLEYIDKFNKNPNLYMKDRILIKNRFHAYQDYNSCKRVFNAIKDIILENMHCKG